MENVLAKSPENRRGKFLVIGLVVVICVLSLQVYQQHILKKNLIRRKAFLLERLRESKAAESKSTYTLKLKILEVQDQKKKIDAKSQEIENVKKDLTSLTNDYNKKINDLQKLRTSATESKERLEVLQKDYTNASFVLSAMKDKLQRTISSYEKVKHEKDALNEEISKRESTLGECLKEKKTLQDEKQVLAERLEKTTPNLVAGRQSVASSNTIQNQPSLKIAAIPLAQYIRPKGETRTASRISSPRPAQNQNSRQPSSRSTVNNTRSDINKTPSNSSHSSFEAGSPSTVTRSANDTPRQVDAQ